MTKPLLHFIIKDTCMHQSYICIRKVCMTNPLLHNALLRRESSPHNVHHRGAIAARVPSGQAEQNGGEEKNLKKDMIQFLGARMAKIFCLSYLCQKSV